MLLDYLGHEVNLSLSVISLRLDSFHLDHKLVTLDLLTVSKAINLLVNRPLNITYVLESSL